MHELYCACQLYAAKRAWKYFNALHEVDSSLVHARDVSEAIISEDIRLNWH